MNPLTPSIERLQLSEAQVFTDYQACLETTGPEIVILCPARAEHGEWVERVAPFGAHLIVEKPFAANLMEADRMINAARENRVRLMINWPIRWQASHSTAKQNARTGSHWRGARGSSL